MTPVELSVVVLCYGGEEDLHSVLGPLHAELEASGISYELILVANYWPGSGDRTPEEAATFAAGRPEVAVVALPKGGAMGWDLRSGLTVARGEYLVYLDGDGQVPTSAVLQVYRRLKETGAPVVKGRRHPREDGSVRTITSLGFNALFRILFGTKGLWDVNGQPKGMTRIAYEWLDLRTDDWFTDAEIVLKARTIGLDVVEMPVRFLAKRRPGSHVSVGTVWEFLSNMIRWRRGRHPAQRAVLVRRPAAVARARR